MKLAGEGGIGNGESFESPNTAERTTPPPNRTPTEWTEMGRDLPISPKTVCGKLLFKLLATVDLGSSTSRSARRSFPHSVQREISEQASQVTHSKEAGRITPTI